MALTPVILVADDDPGILKLVRLQLTDAGFRVLTASDGERAVSLLDEHRPDLIVLDLALPGLSGYEVMRHVQARTNTPILVLTAHSKDAERVRGLELGADDYMAKPFNPDELVARVRAVLRRVRRTAGPVRSHLRLRDVEIDLEGKVVSVNGEPVALTRTEWALLHVLAENAGKVMLNPELLSRVWGPEYRDDIQYLRVWVSRLRRKLEPDRPDDSMIRTFPGMGYMLEAPESAKVPAAR